MQSRFFDKVRGVPRRPDEHAPEPKLVLLGDYIDRGHFSYNGVLRTVLQLLATAPEHVYVLRGNHEYYLEYKGQIYGGVKPAEAINTLKPHLPIEVFEQLHEPVRRAAEHARSSTASLFVHGGIPRDRLLKEHWKDLSQLNDPDLRFQMMWSDPRAAGRRSPRTCRSSRRASRSGGCSPHAFLQRIGCHTLVRGHEKVDEGFKRIYDDGHVAAHDALLRRAARRTTTCPRTRATAR